MLSWLSNIKNKIIDWCVNRQSVAIGDLHQQLSPSKCEIYDGPKVKFIEQAYTDDIYVETPSGYSKVKQSLKTIDYRVWTVNTENHNIACADNHIVIMADGSQKFVRQLIIGDSIKTKNGIEQVTDIEIKGYKEEMYDLELDDEDHVYYTNGILSHNSTVAAAFLLWYAVFNFDKTVLIASRANDHAMEMIERIRFAYEYLPFWLKPGVRDDGWNKHTLGFDNGSRIMSTATAGNSGRGFSISLLYLDEFAFVAPNIQDEFWTSISPTLATGGSCIMTSTPNGDMDIFAEIWRGANIPGADPTSKRGHNEFRPIRVYWDQPPGRDSKFKDAQIAKIGERKWMQEYECVFLSSDALLISSLYLANQTPIIEKIKPIKVIKDVVFFNEIRRGGTYLLGVDPATGTGEDYSVITLFEFPSLIQAAEYRSNTMSTNKLHDVLKNLLLYLESLNCLVYFSIENNGVGEGVIALYEADEEPPETSEFISEEGKGKRGFTTSNKTKMRSCVNLKEMYENGKITIQSRVLLAELKAFIRHKGSYAAQKGSTDDAISALLIVIRLVEEISSYEQEAFDKLYANEFNAWGDAEWDGYSDGYDDNDEGMPIII
jgi:hypothetical protein